MNAAIFSGRMVRLRLFAQRTCNTTCHRVVKRCLLSTSTVAEQMHTSLHQFTDDESMMRDTGIEVVL